MTIRRVQFTYGHAALGRQLHALGLKDEPGLDMHASVVGHLMRMYEGMGNTLAHQVRLPGLLQHACGGALLGRQMPC